MPTFSVMTWNVENLFADKPEFENKLKLLAGVIGVQRPDVVALQEVGGDAEMIELKKALKGDYPHHVVGIEGDRGIRVALLSKPAFTGQAENITAFTLGPAIVVNDLDVDSNPVPVKKMSRGALRVSVTKGSRMIDVLTLHLKSKLLSYKRPGGTSFAPRNENERAQVAGIALAKRTAEAITVRTRANALLVSNSTNSLVVLGDFNDEPEAQTSLILNGPSGSELGTQGFHRPDQGDDARLFNVAPLIPADRRYSRINFGRKELIDQIFASEELFPRIDDQHRRLPIADSLVDFNAQLPSVTNDPNERDGAVAPDHAPVTAVFEL
jgi:endonuclease/exonuclease/phosphatase family metal-dependent hydrolase